MFDSLAATTYQTGIRLASMRECPADMPGCARAQRHRDNFVAGRYNRAQRHIAYGKRIKRQILRMGRTVWHRKYPNRQWSGYYSWRELRRGDSCIVSTYGTRSNTCIQQQAEDFHRYNIVLKKVAICGSALIPVFRVKSLADRLITALPGGVVCPWTYVDDDV